MNRRGGPPHRGQSFDLAAHFAQALRTDSTLVPGDKLVVALSGGVDSTVLLHLLKFYRDLPPVSLLAAHFDHGMRPSSREDRLWVAGLCRAWGVPLHIEVARTPPSSEEEARDRRYAFLLEVKRREEAAWILTGHQGDDQAETVLFRVLRGTGLRGLAGIPRERDPGIYRPLLPFSRNRLMDYARRHRIPFREDPSNLDLTYARNFLRHRVLPLLQSGPMPQVKNPLRRLARLAQENERAWETLLPGLLEGVVVEEGGQTFIVRDRLLAYDPAVQTRLLREIFRRSGLELDEPGTRAAVEFTRTGGSGRFVTLPGGMCLFRDFHRFRVGNAKDRGDDQPLTLSDPVSGSGTCFLDGCRFEVVWGPSSPEVGHQSLEAPRSALVFPLSVRGWVPGDKIQLSYGTKKLKKLFAEAKVPVNRRGRIPVVQDGGGRVLWVSGIASSLLVRVNEGSETLFIGIRNVDKS